VGIKKRATPRAIVSREEIAEKIRATAKRTASKREPEAPEGFIPLVPRDPEAAADLMRQRLRATSQALDLPSRVRIHQNKDDSVDGELTINVPRGMTAREIFLGIEAAFEKQGLAREYWISAGERFVVREDEEVYRRYRGMNDIQTYYQRINQTNVAETLLAARTIMDAGMRKKYGRKAEIVYVRVHWNPTGEKPHRDRRAGGKR
jgi:hypothetical protein